MAIALPLWYAVDPGRWWSLGQPDGLQVNKGQPPPPGARGWDRLIKAPRDLTHTLFRVLRPSWQEGGDGSEAHYGAVGNRHRQRAERPGLMLGGVEVDGSTMQGCLLQGQRAIYTKSHTCLPHTLLGSPVGRRKQPPVGLHGSQISMGRLLRWLGHPSQAQGMETCWGQWREEAWRTGSASEFDPGLLSTSQLGGLES